MKRISAGGPGFQESIFIAEETIPQRCAVVITNVDNTPNNARRVSMGSTALNYAGIGVSIGGAASGQPCRVVTHGVVSGVVLASVVGIGDGLAVANVTSGGGYCSGYGKLTALRTITPAGTIATSAVTAVTIDAAVGFKGTYALSGYLTSGSISGLAATAVTALSAALTGTAVNTARIIAKALMSGGMGSAIPVMVIGVA